MVKDWVHKLVISDTNEEGNEKTNIDTKNHPNIRISASRSPKNMDFNKFVTTAACVNKLRKKAFANLVLTESFGSSFQ